MNRLMPASAFCDVLDAGGETGALIRLMDWTGHPLGEPTTWPQSLRSVLSICLHSSVVTCLFWGPERRMLYNDAYAHALGDRHPRAIGRAAQEIWAHIWDILGPQFESVMSTGRGILIDNQRILIERDGYTEQTFWSYGLSPIRGENDAVIGVFNTAVDITAQVVAQRRQAFLLTLGGRLRDLLEPREVACAAMELLVAHLDVERSGYAEMAEDDRHLAVVAEWAASDGRIVGGSDLPGNVEAKLVTALRRGQTIRIDDRAAEPAALDLATAFVESHINAALTVPLLKGARLVASLHVHPREARRWTQEEISLVQEVAERTWIEVGRARAEKGRRADAQFLAGILASSADCIKVLDLDGNLTFMSPEGMRIMEVSDFNAIRDCPWPNFWKEKGHTEAVAAVEMARAGGAGRFQGFAETMAGTPRWWDVQVTPILGSDGRPERLLSVSRDITSTRRAEDGLREAQGLNTLILASSRDCIVVLDLKGHTLFVSPGGIEGMEISDVSQIIGLCWLRVWAGQDHDRARAAVAEARNGGTGRFQGFCPTHRGKPKWWDVVISPLNGPDGQPERLVSVARDVTERVEAESQLMLSVESFQLATEAAEVGTWDLDIKTDILNWSDRTKAMFGISPDVPCSMADFYAGLHPDDQAATFDAFASAVDPAQRATYDVEYRTIGKEDGLIRWIAAKGRGFFAADGTCVRAIGTAIDITARKQAETRQALLLSLSDQLSGLSEPREIMATAVRTLGQHLGVNRVGYGQIEPDDETVVLSPGYVNGVLQISGSFSIESFGTITADLHRRGLPAMSCDVLADSLDPASWATLETRAFVSVPLVRDGRLRASLYVNQTEPRVWTPSEVTLIEEVGARTWDALERSRAEEALRQLNATLEARVAERTRERDRLWELSEDLLVVANFEGRLLRVSPSWSRVLGYPEETLLSLPYTDLIHPDDFLDVTQALTIMRDSGRSVSFEDRVRAADGTWRWVDWTLSPEPGGGRLSGVGRDVTEEKVRRAELDQTQEALRQSQKMEAVGQLTGGIAHDFNNLLQIVSGNLQLLSGHVSGNEKAERRVNAALAGVNRGAKLANSLLAFSRRQALQPKVLNIGRLVAEMDDMLRRAIGAAIELETIVSGGLWNVFIDPIQIENAVLNLAINARDAMSGTGRLTIEISNALLEEASASRQDAVAGEYVMLAVADTGTGMTPEVMRQVFEPFFSTKPEGHGTGLGLSMVYGFVKQSGGHVEIDSKVGTGTTMKLYLPRVLDPEDAPDTTNEGPVVGGSETVLVAEDDDAVRDTVVEMLIELGYRVLKVKDASAALTVIESGVFVDLLFTDVVMPGTLKSADLARLARERLPGLAVLFTSGYTQNAVLYGGGVDGGVELISKPYTRELLARKLRQVLLKMKGAVRA